MSYCPECLYLNRLYTVNFINKVYLPLNEGDGKGYPYCKTCGLVLNREASVTRRVAIYYIKKLHFIPSIEHNLIKKLKKRQITPYEAMQTAEYYIKQPGSIKR